MKNVAVLLVGGVRAAQPSFEQWQSQWGIKSADDEMRANYLSDVKRVDEMNAEGSDATFAVNQFSGMAFADFQGQYLRRTLQQDTDFPTLEVSQELAKGVDWVKKGMVTPVRNQGHCGSCWAFSAIGAMESVYKQQFGVSTDLSAEQLVDCTYPNFYYYSSTHSMQLYDGCNGGNFEDAYAYLKENTACTANSYSYVASGKGAGAAPRTCQAGSCTSAGFVVSGYNHAGKTEHALASALQHSVVAVYVEVTNRFASYASGILDDKANHQATDHAVVAVGYNKNFFKIKNSWGAEWGEDGYIRISKGKGWKWGSFAVVANKGVIPVLHKEAPYSPSPSPEEWCDSSYYSCEYYSSTAPASMEEVDAEVVV